MMFRTTLLFLLPFVSGVCAATYYCDPANGRPDGDGSAERPWGTVQSIIEARLIELRTPRGEPGKPSARVRAGDTVLLRSGWHGVIRIPSGYNDQPITIAAEPGHRPGLGWVDIGGGRNWVIRGLTISPSLAPAPLERVPRSLVSLGEHGGEDSTGLIVEDCFIYSVLDPSGWSAADWVSKAHSGIWLGRNGSAHVARNNYVLNTRFGINLCAPGCVAEGNVVANFSADALRVTRDGQVVQHNVIKNIFVGARDGDDNHDDGIQAFLFNVGTGTLRDVVLRGNIIIARETEGLPYATGLQGIGCFDGPLVNFLVESNVVAVNHSHGISLYDAQGCTIRDNTCYNGRGRARPWIMLGQKKNQAAGNSVRNNLAHSYNFRADKSVTAEENAEVTEEIFRQRLDSLRRLIDSTYGAIHPVAKRPRIETPGPGASTSPIEVSSPDGKVIVRFELKPLGGETNVPVYSVHYGRRAVLSESKLGLELRDGSLSRNLRLAGQKTSAGDTTWRPVCGEREIIRDNYHQLEVELKPEQQPDRRLFITFRAYNEGAAFSYRVSNAGAPKEMVITRELSQFAFTGDHTAWAVYHAQGNYDPNDPRRRLNSPPSGPVPLSQLRPGVERPLTVQVTDDLYVAVTEAGLVDYARMKLRPTPGRLNTLQAFLDAERGAEGEVTGQTPFSTPWRVIMLAKSPGKLLEQNYLVLNLNAPCALPDTSWIKPGKVIREATLTTAGGKGCVDFALKCGLQYIEYDAGWYGAEADPKSDAREVNLDPKRNPNPDSLNLQEVIDYANARGIGVILYVNHIALERQLDELLPLYAKWGVKGMKFGFVNVGSQRWTKWLHDAIRRAAAYRMMVDVHDEYRSTGIERTYPNLMTVEGICGNEEFPSPTHNAALPFTRFLTGPGDYTYCWRNSRLKVTPVHQLALSTIYYSPWQFLFWYSKPGDVKEEPALDYWKQLPTSWDETRVVQGDIGQRAVMARRKGQDWFIGAISLGLAVLEVPFDFLPRGKEFDACIYSDGDDGHDLRVEMRKVDASSRLKAEIAPNGGLAVRLTPSVR